MLTAWPLIGFDWDALPSGSLIVDVGGGIGSQSLIVAESHPHLNFIVQDQTAMMKGATAVRTVLYRERARNRSLGEISHTLTHF